MEDYSQLPEEIVEKITTEHLETFSQLIAFSGVCTSWRSAALDSYNRRRQRQVPFLPGFLISNYEELCQPHHQFRPISTVFDGVDSLVKPPRRWSPPDFQTNRRMHLLGLEESSDPNSTIAAVDLDIKDLHCVASRDGWLVLSHPAIRRYMDTTPLRICLLNPVTGAYISLPPLLHDQFKFRYSYTVLSSSPDYDDDCHVILTRGDSGVLSSSPQVAWCKVRGGCWKFTSNDFKLFNIVECATYFGGKLYVVDRENYVHVFSNLLINTTDETPPFTVRSFLFSSAMLYPYLGEEEYNPHGRWTNLFELNGELIVILRHFNFSSIAIQVYKLALVQASSDHSWEEVKSLDGYAVFLGTHQSLCVAMQNDEIVKGNHVYYLNYSCGHCHFVKEYWDNNINNWFLCSSDCGVYSLEHRKVVEHTSSRNLYHDYVWFSPMPCFFCGYMGLYNYTDRVHPPPGKRIVHVEFDYFVNPAWDPPYQHVGINNNSLSYAVFEQWISDPHPGHPILVEINYSSSTHNLTVSWEYGNSRTWSLWYVIDLRKVLPESVIMGFSATCNDFSGEQELLSWDFTSDLEMRESSFPKKKLMGIVALIAVIAIVANPDLAPAPNSIQFGIQLAGSGGDGKKKRGRPRKYRPDCSFS
ncbi:L-type lectin-domain containing receptor kinase IX.1, partial [Linum perenne]